jgi:ribosomal protein L13E
MVLGLVKKVIGGAGKSSSKTEPWKAAQPYLKDIMSSAGGMFEDGTLGGVRPTLGTTTRAGMSSLASLGRGGSVGGQAADNLSAFLGGPRFGGEAGYSSLNPGGVQGPGSFDVSSRLPDGPSSYGSVDPNGGIDAVRQNIMAETLPQIAGMFGTGGFSKSTMAQSAAGRAMASALAPYEYQQINRNEDVNRDQFNREQERDLNYGLASAGLEADQFNINDSRRVGFDVNERNVDMNQYNVEQDRGFDQFLRQNQQQLEGIGLAPTIGDAQYRDAQSLFGLGQFKDQHKQNRQNFDVNNLNAAANFFLPFGQLGTASTNKASPLDTIGKIGQGVTSLFGAF